MRRRAVNAEPTIADAAPAAFTTTVAAIASSSTAPDPPSAAAATTAATATTSTVQELSAAAFARDVAEQRARTVWVSFRIVNITAVDLVACRCTVDFYLFLSWEDPAMVGIQRGDPRFRRTADEYEGLWHPMIEINNGIGLEPQLNADLSWNFKDATTGLMSFTQRYRGDIVCDAHLASFPFDSFDVGILIGPKLYKSDKVRLVRSDTKDPNHNIILKTSLPEWSLVPGRPALHELETALKYSNLRFSFALERLYGYYLWKVVFIQLMLSMLSWTVPFMGVHAFSERLNTMLTLFLSSVAFLYVVNDKIPMVSYLTILDKITLSSFFLLFLMAVESFLVFIISSPEHVDDEALAKSVDRFACVLFPVSSVACVGTFILQGLSEGWRRARLAAGSSSAPA